MMNIIFIIFGILLILVIIERIVTPFSEEEPYRESEELYGGTDEEIEERIKRNNEM